MAINYRLSAFGFLASPTLQSQRDCECHTPRSATRPRMGPDTYCQIRRRPGPCDYRGRICRRRISHAPDYCLLEGWSWPRSDVQYHNLPHSFHFPVINSRKLLSNNSLLSSTLAHCKRLASCPSSALIAVNTRQNLPRTICKLHLWPHGRRRVHARNPWPALCYKDLVSAPSRLIVHDRLEFPSPRRLPSVFVAPFFP